MDSAPETASEHPKGPDWAPSNDTPHPDRPVSTVGDTLLDLETPKDPASANITEDSTEETTLLARGSQEVSGLDSISCKEEDDLLSSTLQESTGENPIEGVSPVESGHLPALS